MTKLAFLISAHTDAPHLLRLVDSLPRHSDFYIHIDRKADLSVFRAVLSRPNVHFIAHRVDVVWGSLREVEYQMEMIRAALRDGRADYLITLSGLDYPIWSNRRITDFFENAGGREFVRGIPMLRQGQAVASYREYRFFSSYPWRPGSIASKMRVALRKTVAAMGIRKPLEIKCPEKTYVLHKGAAWWAMTPGLATHVLQQWDNNKALVSYFKTSFCPAETFVQTVAFNSGFASRCMPAEGQYESLAALTPLTYIYYHPVIKIMTEDDYDTLKASGKMFCRKVTTRESGRLMDMLDAERAEGCSDNGETVSKNTR